jgi:hypothetical protein
VLLCVSVGLVGCACRKLPGPSECQRVAAAILGIQDATVLADPRVKHEFDQLTTDCLLTPFDRELVRCIEESNRSRLCLGQFRYRLEAIEQRNDSEPDYFDEPVRRW